ncbi:hypothetical protein AVEN_148942-1 [Araneus ventricosus]|uniref:Uncharacterized protein n=1 Tax=Araneus ventricosus TaxID=182803 RepID=A0A4Y2FMA6_ARAVE|nr:hypothetical protein AVEN_148942-1 [Araneus ventricosus]
MSSDFAYDRSTSTCKIGVFPRKVYCNRPCPQPRRHFRPPNIREPTRWLRSGGLFSEKKTLSRSLSLEGCQLPICRLSVAAEIGKWNTTHFFLVVFRPTLVTPGSGRWLQMWRRRIVCSEYWTDEIRI